MVFVSFSFHNVEIVCNRYEFNQIHFSTLNRISAFYSLQSSVYGENPDFRQQKHVPALPIEKIKK